MDILVDGSRSRTLASPVAAALLALLVAVAGCGSDDSGGQKGQTVRFQKPTEVGADPFTRPADISGGDRVQVGSGPFGGTGSDLVCDRTLLVRSLRARPDRLRAWARVVRIEPTIETVELYIKRLKPVTLTRDTRVTNHSFAAGKATGYQAILQAGTAVLVDEFGHYRARCRCGNPLLEPIFIPEATCLGCPPNYTPPPPCEPESECYEPYPHPPPVDLPEDEQPETTPAQPPPQQTQPQQPPPQQAQPSASFSPSSGPRGTAFTLSISGFSPNATVPFTITRPDGATEDYSISTGDDGSGSFPFPPTEPNTLLGTFTATVRDPRSGATAQASATVTGG